MTMNSTMKKWLFVAPTLIFLLMGCGPNIVVHYIDKESRPPNSGQLDIYQSGEEVKRPYKIIMIIRGEDKRVAANRDKEQLKRKIFAKAKKSGADGLIITKTGTRNFRTRDGMGGSVPHSAKYVQIEAIVYLDK